jgi:hypothetical protein
MKEKKEIPQAINVIIKIKNSKISHKQELLLQKVNARKWT